MEEKEQGLSERESELADFGFLNAVGRIHQKLSDDEKEVFKSMLSKAFKSEAPKILEEGIETINNSNGCPPNCSYVRGLGCICD